MLIENVELGKRAYPIYIGRGALNLAREKLEELKAEKKSAFIVADAKIEAFHKSKIEPLKNFAKILVKNGTEATKTFSELEDLCSAFARAGLDRKSAVFALGGGVIGDLTGFAAAVYMRSIDFYQIPTTLLAMVDSSVGGKTGINIDEGKNLVGAFHQPQAVFADIDFLDSLAPREFAAGMAELIKCGLLGDAEFFEELESAAKPLSPENQKMGSAILRACTLKASVVAADERETSKSGGRALLNLGHTFGHSIEHCAGYGTYLHGEAVSIGTVMAAELSTMLGDFKSSDVERIKKVFVKYGLPVSLRKPLNADEMLESMFHDKKTMSGNLRFVVFDEIGKTRTTVVEPSVVLDVLRNFCR